MYSVTSGPISGTRIMPMSVTDLTGLSPREQGDRLSDVQAEIDRIVGSWNGRGFDAETSTRFALLIAEKRKLEMARAAQIDPEIAFRHAG
ncbi:hypothetical protein LX81_00060 [Palleronia aestuarii]|uniref:Uncharacterized protein n=1 Tax=Palleronia aestuarii TaxID=568105 RepID=A0A2W7NSL5_9RHOB|nr:hypothetical protein [Palleronia aestuarii]PZX19604.1 hypothetical protein LX81_00060 [Palleronia aestuarii]